MVVSSKGNWKKGCGSRSKATAKQVRGRGGKATALQRDGAQQKGFEPDRDITNIPSVTRTTAHTTHGTVSTTGLRIIKRGVRY